MGEWIFPFLSPLSLSPASMGKPTYPLGCILNYWEMLGLYIAHLIFFSLFFTSC
jgi:hypothetical protein